MRTKNLGDATFAYEDDDPAGYRAGMDRFGPSIGARRIGGSVYELPPGQAICPYHYEHGCEEWLLVLAGTPTLRHPGGEDVLRPLDVVCFPEGPEGAHLVRNDTEAVARVLMLSTKPEMGVAVYPDSDKIGIWPTADGTDHVMVRRSSAVGYWDGEVPTT